MRPPDRYVNDTWSTIHHALDAKRFQHAFSLIEEYLDAHKLSPSQPDDVKGGEPRTASHWFSPVALSRELLQCRGLQIYCLLKLGKFEEAAGALDEFESLPISGGEALSGASYDQLLHVLRRTSAKEAFFLFLLTALLPLLYMQKNREKRQPQSTSCESYSTGGRLREIAFYAQRFYRLLSWTRNKVLLAAREIETSCLNKEKALLGSVTLPNASEADIGQFFDTYALWASRHWVALHCFTNCLLQSDAVESAISLIKHEMNDVAQQFLAETPQAYYPHYLLGRAHLAAGDFNAALWEFKLTATLLQTVDTSNRYETFLQTVMAIIYLCTERVDAAVSLFSAHHPPTTLLDPIPPSPSSLQSKVCGHLVVALNNLAVACLYKGSVRDAIAHLERFVFSPISKEHSEVPFFAAFRNLLTLYEFTPNAPLRMAGLRNIILQDTGPDDTELLSLFDIDDIS